VREAHHEVNLVGNTARQNQQQQQQQVRHKHHQCAAELQHVHAASLMHHEVNVACSGKFTAIITAIAAVPDARLPWCGGGAVLQHLHCYIHAPPAAFVHAPKRTCAEQQDAVAASSSDHEDFSLAQLAPQNSGRREHWQV
jgi:hypothetical protein